jgi:segregation and condensation protein A
MAEEITYQIGDFDGPLDLLLHLIKVNEMEIMDIPIVEITEQYLDFLHGAQQRDLDVAGEFLVMAATLMSIKARYLLPKPEPDFEELAEIVYEEDPREALMAQLLEYQRYQQAADELREREDARQLQFSRSPMPLPEGIEVAPLPDGLELHDLQSAFTQMVNKRSRLQKRPRTMQGETWSISRQMTTIMQKLAIADSMVFDEIFEDDASKDLLVTTFLAMLELVRHQHLMVSQDGEFGEITLAVGKVPYSEEVAEGELAEDE